MNERKLIEKLRLVEALFDRAGTDGERVAADIARNRIMARLRRKKRVDPPIEYSFYMPDMWSRKVMVALLRRYGLKPYRYYRQRHTTVMARVPKTFVDETLWPQYLEYSKALDQYLAEVTDRVVHSVIHEDSSEASVVKEGLSLPGHR